MAVTAERNAARSLRLKAMIEHTIARMEAKMSAMPIGAKTEAPNQSLSGWGAAIPAKTPAQKSSTGPTIAHAVKTQKRLDFGSLFIGQTVCDQQEMFW